jgi:hypothetical protein
MKYGLRLTAVAWICTVGASLHAMDACCPSTPETALWSRFAAIAQAKIAAGGSAFSVLPAAPAGVTDLRLAELIAPSGDRGLEYSAKAQASAGQRVRLTGFMVNQQVQAPGVFLLTAQPFMTTEKEDGLCENLPAATVHVLVPELSDRRIPLMAGPLVLIGTLELGSHPEADGRNSVLRLRLESPSMFAPAKPVAVASALPASAGGKL